MYKRFNEIEKDLNEKLKESGLNPEYNRVDIDKIKENTFSKIFEENNTFRVEYKTNILNERDTNKNSLKYDEQNIKTFLEETKKRVLAYSTKERKIKETEQYLNLEKMFNDDKQKYFSLWDLQKKIKAGELTINDLVKRLEEAKVLIFSKYHYKEQYENWRNEEGLIKMFEFFNLILFDKLPALKTIDNNPKNRFSPISEKEFNEAGIKVKLFNEHYYYYPTGKEDKVLLFVKEQLKKRLVSE